MQTISSTVGYKRAIYHCWLGTALAVMPACGSESAISAGPAGTGATLPAQSSSAGFKAAVDSGGAGAGVVPMAGSPRSPGVGAAGRPSLTGGSGMSATASGSAGSSIASADSSGAIARAGSGGSVAARAGAEGATTAGRAGSATTAGHASPAGASSEVPTGDAQVCKGKTSQVAIIGDSFINWTSHNLPSDLAMLAGETWRLYAEGGASLQAGGIATLIPDQLEIAIADDPDIKVLVMDGGGNDVLICDAGKYLNCSACSADGASRQPVCGQIADDSIATFNKLQDRALSIGVRDIVYFYYPDVPTGTIIGGSNPNEVARFAQPKWQGSCDDVEKRTNGKMRCHFVDMVPVFKGHPDYFAVTDIHPNPMGSAAMAKAIIDKMKEDCVWQPAGECSCQP